MSIEPDWTWVLFPGRQDRQAVGYFAALNPLAADNSDKPQVFNEKTVWSVDVLDWNCLRLHITAIRPGKVLLAGPRKPTLMNH